MEPSEAQYLITAVLDWAQFLIGQGTVKEWT